MEGFGRYPALPVEEIERLLAACLEDESPRALTAALRITREQLDARGGLGDYRKLSVGAVLIGALLLPVYFLSAEGGRELVLKAEMAVGSSLFLLLVLQWSMRHSIRNAVAAEREIVRIAGEAAQGILARPGFRARGLQREHRDTLQRLAKATGRENLRLLAEAEVAENA